MVENDKELVGRFWEEVFGRGDPDALDELLAPGYKFHDLANRKKYDAKSLKGLVSGIRAGMPGARVFREDQMSAEDSKVVTRFTVHVRLRDGVATNEEPGPDDEELELNGMSISRVVGGGIEESWVLWESLLAEQKIGPPKTAPELPVRRSWWWPPWR